MNHTHPQASVTTHDLEYSTKSQDNKTFPHTKTKIKNAPKKIEYIQVLQAMALFHIFPPLPKLSIENNSLENFYCKD